MQLYSKYQYNFVIMTLREIIVIVRALSRHLGTLPNNQALFIKIIQFYLVLQDLLANTTY